MTNESRQMKVEPDVHARLKEVQKKISPERNWSDYYQFSLSDTVKYLLEVRDELIKRGIRIHHRPHNIENIEIVLPDADEDGGS